MVKYLFFQIIFIAISAIYCEEEEIDFSSEDEFFIVPNNNLSLVLTVARQTNEFTDCNDYWLKSPQSVYTQYNGCASARRSPLLCTGAGSTWLAFQVLYGRNFQSKKFSNCCIFDFARQQCMPNNVLTLELPNLQSNGQLSLRQKFYYSNRKLGSVRYPKYYLKLGGDDDYDNFYAVPYFEKSNFMDSYDDAAFKMNYVNGVFDFYLKGKVLWYDIKENIVGVETTANQAKYVGENNDYFHTFQSYTEYIRFLEDQYQWK